MWCNRTRIILCSECVTATQPLQICLCVHEEHLSSVKMQTVFASLGVYSMCAHIVGMIVCIFVAKVH